MKLFKLDPRYGFVKIDDKHVAIRKVNKGWEKEGFITSTTPRVIVHAEKEGSSDIVKDVRVEFSLWEFPTLFFLRQGRRVSIKCEHYVLYEEVCCFSGLPTLPYDVCEEVRLS